HGGERRQRHRPAGQLLGEETVGHHVGVGAAVRFRVAEGEEALLGQAAKEGARKLAGLVQGGRPGGDLGVHQARDRRPEGLLLGAQPEVEGHGRTMLRPPTRWKLCSVTSAWPPLATLTVRSEWVNFPSAKSPTYLKSRNRAPTKPWTPGPATWYPGV